MISFVPRLLFIATCCLFLIAGDSSASVPLSSSANATETYQRNSLVLIVTVFISVILVLMAYGRWIRVKLQFQAEQKQTFIDSLLENTRDGIWIANKDREIEKVNEAFEAITGHKANEVINKCFKVFKESGRNYEVESLIWQEVVKVGFWSGEIWTFDADNQKISIDLSVTRVATTNKMTGQVDIKFIGVMSDITNRKVNEQNLHQLATRDQLTQLPNRTLFVEYIKHSISTNQSNNPHFAILFIDLDNFKKVNSSVGLLQGDKLLSQVAERLTEKLDDALTLARLGGDEFALLVPSHLCGTTPVFYLKTVINEIQSCFKNTFSLDGADVNMTCSIGVSIYPKHGTQPDELMRCADTALNRVKISGRNGAVIFDHVMDDMTTDSLNIESELVAAINNEELEVYYQPLYNSVLNHIYGFEALLRWHSPERGVVPPDQFIPIAEDNGLIRFIDLYVLRKAFAANQRWLEQGLMRGRIAVNISSNNFQQADFVNQIKELVHEVEGDCSQIELELTETAMMMDPQMVSKNIAILKGLGFKITLDDFGTGFSSLGHLKQFNIDKVKIDRSFVHEIEHSEQDKNIASVIIQLGHHLGIEIVGEGVENENQSFMLHVMGCVQQQGYLISKPLPEPQLIEFLNKEDEFLTKISAGVGL